MRKNWKLLSVALAASVLLISAIFLYFYFETKSTVDQKMHQEITSIDHKASVKKLKEQKPLTILLLGVDEREGDKGRSDTIMILHLNTEEAPSYLISIPRDTRTTLIGDTKESGKVDKINHAYAYGGTDMAVQTVEALLNAEMDYYIKINMEGLEEVVDTLGTVTVQNGQNFSADGIHFPEGPISLTGEEALAYVQMRKNDPQGDMGRNARQRQLIEAIFDQGASFTSLNKVGSFLETTGENVTTDMDFENIRSLSLHYRSARTNLEEFQMTGEDAIIEDIYYLKVPEEEIEKTASLLSPPE